MDTDELDIGICTQISDGGQVIAHDSVVWVANRDFVLQRHKTLSLATFEIDCFSEYIIKLFRKKTET